MLNPHYEYYAWCFDGVPTWNNDPSALVFQGKTAAQVAAETGDAFFVQVAEEPDCCPDTDSGNGYMPFFVPPDEGGFGTQNFISGLGI